MIDMHFQYPFDPDFQAGQIGRESFRQLEPTVQLPGQDIRCRRALPCSPGAFNNRKNRNETDNLKGPLRIPRLPGTRMIDRSIDSLTAGEH